MSQEDKELLLKDLCGRLPYKPRIMYYYIDDIDGKEYTYSCNLITHYIDELYSKTTNMSHIKPYLRSMSSMTEEEKREYESFIGGQKPFDSDFSAYPKEYRFVYEWDVANYVKWLNAHHFDYRGLIEKGLAIEAPEDMYKEGQ